MKSRMPYYVRMLRYELSFFLFLLLTSLPWAQLRAQGVIPLTFTGSATGHSAVIIVEPIGGGQARVTLTEALGYERPLNNNVIVNQYTLPLDGNGRLTTSSIQFIRDNILGQGRVSGGVQGYWIDVTTTTAQRMTGYAFDVANQRIPFDYRLLQCNCANYVLNVLRQDANLSYLFSEQGVGTQPAAFAPRRLDNLIYNIWQNQVQNAIVADPSRIINPPAEGLSRIYGNFQFRYNSPSIPGDYFRNRHWFQSSLNPNGFSVANIFMNSNLGSNGNETYNFTFGDAISSNYTFKAFDFNNAVVDNFAFWNGSGNFTYTTGSIPIKSFEFADATGATRLFSTFIPSSIGAVDFRNIDVQAIDVNDASKTVNFILSANNNGTNPTSNIQTQAALLKKVFLQTLAVPNDKQVVSLDILSNPSRGLANADATFKNTDVCRFFYEADSRMKFDLLYNSLSGSGSLNQGITADWINLIKASPYYTAWASKGINFAFNLRARFIILPDFTDASKGNSKTYITDARFKIDRFVDELSMNLAQPGLTAAEITDLQSRLDQLRTKVFQRLDAGIATVLPNLNGGVAEYKNLRSVLWAIVAAHWYKTANIPNKQYASLINSNNLTGITTSIPFDQAYWDAQAYRLLGVERYTDFNGSAITQNFFGGTEIKTVNVDQFLSGMDTIKARLVDTMRFKNYQSVSGVSYYNSGAVQNTMAELQFGPVTTTSSVSGEPQNYLAGRSFSAAVNVRNTGNAAASNVRVFAYLDNIMVIDGVTNVKSTQLINTVTLTSVAAKGGGTANFTFNVTTPGYYRVRFAINQSDDGLTVPTNELDTRNNSYFKILYVDSELPEMEDLAFPNEFTTIIPTRTQLRGSLTKGQDSLYNFTWVSNINGTLGNSRILNVVLSPGNHVLSLQIKNKTTNAIVKTLNFNVQAVASRIKLTRHKNPFTARVNDRFEIPVVKGTTVNGTSTITFAAAAAPVTATSQPTARTGAGRVIVADNRNGIQPAYPAQRNYAGHHNFIRAALSDNYTSDAVTVTRPVNIRESMHLDATAITINGYYNLLQTGKDFTVQFQIYTPAGVLALTQNVNITGLTNQTNVWVPLSISGLTGDGVWRVVMRSKYATDASFLDDGSFTFVKSFNIGTAWIARGVMDTLPQNASTLISPNDHRVYFITRLDNVPEGMDVRWEWYTPSGTLYSTSQTSFPDPEGKQYRHVYLIAYIDVKGRQAEALRGNWQPAFLVKRLGTRSATWKRYNGGFTMSNLVFNLQANVAANSTNEINVTGQYNFTTNITGATELNNYVAGVTAAATDTVWVPVISEYSQGGAMRYSANITYANGTSFTDGPWGVDSTNALMGRFANMQNDDPGIINQQVLDAITRFDKHKNVLDPEVYSVWANAKDIVAPEYKPAKEAPVFPVAAEEITTARIFPNPVLKESTLFITSKDEDYISADLLRITGDKVRTLFSGQRVKLGLNMLPLQLGDLPSGSYLVRVQFGKSNPQVVKIVKLR